MANAEPMMTEQTAHLTPSPDLEVAGTPLTALLAGMERLANQGIASWLLGLPALRAARGAELPPAGALPLALAAAGRDAARVAAIAQWPAAIAERLQPVWLGSADPAGALTARLGAEPVRSLAIAWRPSDGVREPADDRSALADAADGRLRLAGDLRKLWPNPAAAGMELAIAAAHSGLRPGPELIRQVQREATAVLSLPPERRGALFGQVLMGEFAGCGLRFLLDTTVLAILLPEVTALVDFHKSCPVHHKDIWDHTLQVIEKCPFTLSVRWAALMHDTGKVATRSVSKGKVHFFRHEELGANLMLGAAARFALPTALRDRVCYIIANHARANVYASDWTDSAVRRLVRDMGEHLDDVLAFSRSDWTTKRTGRIAEVKSLAQELAERIPLLAAEDAKVPPLPKGLGTVILAQTGRAPGPWLGKIQRWLEDACEAGQLAPQQDAAYYLEAVRTHAPALLTE